MQQPGSKKDFIVHPLQGPVRSLRKYIAKKGVALVLKEVKSRLDLQIER